MIGTSTGLPMAATEYQSRLKPWQLKYLLKTHMKQPIIVEPHLCFDALEYCGVVCSVHTLVSRLSRCVQEAADATGCGVEISLHSVEACHARVPLLTAAASTHSYAWIQSHSTNPQSMEAHLTTVEESLRFRPGRSDSCG